MIKRFVSRSALIWMILFMNHAGAQPDNPVVDSLFDLNIVRTKPLSVQWCKPLHYRTITAMDISKDGNRLICGGATAVKILTLKDTGFTVDFSFRPFKSNYSCISYSRDEKHYVVGSYGGFQVYQSATNLLYFNYKFPAADNWVQDGFFNARNELLITDWHGKPLIYSIRSNKVIQKFTDIPESSAYANDGRYLSKALNTWLRDSVKMPIANMVWNEGGANSFYHDSAGRQFIFELNSGSDTYLCLWNYQLGKFSKLYKVPGLIYAFFVAPQKGRGLLIYYACEKNLYLLDTKKNNNTFLYTVPYDNQLINCIRVTKDNTSIYIGTEDRSENRRPYLINLINSITSND